MRVDITIFKYEAPFQEGPGKVSKIQGVKDRKRENIEIGNGY